MIGSSVSNVTTAASASPTTVASSPGSLSSVASPATSTVVPPSPPPPPPPPPPMPAIQPQQQKLEQSAPVPPPPPPPPSSVVLSYNSAPVVVKTASDINKNRNRKKSKQKCPPKPRTIKFHEYKGPPNAQKQQPAVPSDVETSYELLLQQQQLFLQWQLEWQHKYPQIILPAKAPSSSPSTNTLGDPGTNLASILSVSAVSTGPSTAATSPAPSSWQANEPATVTTTSTRTRLEEMKVSDLKAELKKRNLPVSGSKPQLIDRLRPFVGEEGTLTVNRSMSRRGSQSQLQQQSLPQQPMLMTEEVPEPSPPPISSVTSRRVSCSSLEGSISSFRASSSEMLLPSLSPTSSAASACSMSPSPSSVRPPSVINMDVDIEMNDASNTLDGTDVKLETPPTPPPLPSQQQQPVEHQIDDLVRGLQEEQRVLLEQQQMLRQQAAATVHEEQVASAANDSKAQQKLLLQQHLQLKIQQQQIQQQLEQLHQLQQQPAGPSSPVGSRTTSSRIVARANRNAAKLQASRSASTSSQPSLGDTPDNLVYPVSSSPSESSPRRPPPPNYSEASRMLQQPGNQTTSTTTLPSSSSNATLKPRVSIKSQLVDDVLDILIRNGELPPSAAHDPITPTTPRDPPPMPPPLPSHLLTKQHQQTLSHPAVSASEIKFPYIDINELGLNLDLDSLGEAMELGVYENHSTVHNPSVTPSAEGGRNDEVTAMEMDVSDWLDTLLPPFNGSQSLPLSSNSSVASSTSSTTSGFSSLGSDQHPYLLRHQQQPHQSFSNNSNQLNQLNQPTSTTTHQQISGDPLFSSLSSDPYTDLFALEDTDMKLPTGLGNTLSWDRLDFTA